ncbi:MAG: arsenate reductase ArsC [Candidatus Omnitrophica bacterium]|nr:arsenate reductase ArsC [Candidatus Omnitrophota bacterium]
MKKKVLFLCTGNSCRSQIAEGFLRARAADRFEVSSAGLRPAYIHALTIKVMQEAGVDISGQYSKSIKEFLKQSFDYVITVCDNAKQVCPVFQGKHKKIHWSIEDPVFVGRTGKERLSAFRNTRDIIKERVEQFISEE